MKKEKDERNRQKKWCMQWCKILIDGIISFASPKLPSVKAPTPETNLALVFLMLKKKEKRDVWI